MMRRALVAVVGMLIVAMLGAHLIAATDPGGTQLEEVGGSKSLVVIVHGLPGPNSLTGLRRMVRADFPNADIMTATYEPSVFANIDPFMVTDSLERGINAAFETKHYDSIVLVGHSLGAVLLRKALVWANGAQEDRVSPQRRRTWPGKVSRFVSLAGINRGWSLDPMPANMSPSTYIAAYLGEWVAYLTGTGGLLFATERGSPFIADLRVQWIKLARQDLVDGKSRLPLSIHLLGDIDDVVSRKDSQDLAASKDTRFITIPNTSHANIIAELERGSDTSQRVRLIRDALTKSEAELPFEVLRVQDENLDVRKIIYILHGIRDYGVWTDDLRKEIEKAKDADTVVTPPKYGYFPMIPFILYWDRQKNVRRFMDEYTENLARFPNVKQLDFIGHSNGTYILASALQRYTTLNVHNVLFAGSVVPIIYPWRELVDAKRVNRVYNLVATDDWVVALFPRFFEQVAEWWGDTSVKGAFDIGSAGFRGFRDSGAADADHRIDDAMFVSGTHSSALDLRDNAKMRGVVQFAVDGNNAQLKALATGTQNQNLDRLSNVSWVVWLALAALLLGIGYAVSAYLGRWGLAFYGIVLIALLNSF